MTDVAGPPVPPGRFSSSAIRGGDTAIEDGRGSMLVIGRDMTKALKSFGASIHEVRKTICGETENMGPALPCRKLANTVTRSLRDEQTDSRTLCKKLSQFELL